MDVVELTKALIRIDTRNPPGKTSQAVDFLQNLFSSFKTRTYGKDGKENLVVEIGKGKRTLMLTSHLDTVPAKDETLNPVLVNGKLFGRGSCDAKGCVASMCCAIEGFEPEFKLKLAFTADEEVGGKNGLKLVFERERADAVVIGEPTGCDSVTVLQASVLALDLRFKGRDGHTAMQDPCEGAILKSASFITEVAEKFRKLSGNYECYKSFFAELGVEFTVKSWEAVFNPSIIQGGVKRNVVAPSCDLYADVRFAPWISVEEVLKLFEREDIETRISGFLPSYGIFVDPVKLEDDLKLLRIIFEAVREEKLKPKAVFSLGVGDSRHVRKFGVPAFYIGPGGGNMHSEDEFVFVSELLLAKRIYRRIVEKFRRF